MKKTLLFMLILFISTALLDSSMLWAQQKHALVIGNSNYRGISTLRNPANDARDMRDALRSLGFSVDMLLNATSEQMESAVVNLGRRLSASSDSYGFFFYAGHGVQSGGENFLIPVNADTIVNDLTLRHRSLSLQFVLDTLSDAGNELNIVVLDSCRDNPFGWNRSGARGLTVVSRAPPGSIVFYATSGGATAADGTGRNGLFTGQLLEHLRTPGLSINDTFQRTGAAVRRVSDGRQIPAVYDQFFGTAYLGSQPSPAPASASTQVTAGFVRINGGTFTMGSPANEPERDRNEDPQRLVTVSSFYMARNTVTVGEFRRFVDATRYRTDAETRGGGFIWVDSGWVQRADANWRNPQAFVQDENHPVVQISWFDAVRYCNWLSEQEGLSPAYRIRGSGNNRTVTWNRNANGYRLPTEAEWEYAARAGTSTAYNTGSTITSSQANINNTLGRTTQVGSYSPNAWGLNDMHGNVWELCWDWYGNYLSGAQSDPTGPSSGTGRVGRGGCWNNGLNVRSALRIHITPDWRNGHVGFRVVRNVN